MEEELTEIETIITNEKKKKMLNRNTAKIG